jgi:Putative auto-transporter adhesin, head GIN domain
VGVKGSLKTRNPLRVRVTAKQLKGLAAESSAKVTGKDLKGDKIDLSASSSGHVTANNVQGGQLKVSVNSAGAVTADGLADRQDVDASSSGRFEGSKLVSRTSRVDCSSAASTIVHATEEVSGSVSSAGSVRYSGSPGKVAVGASSAGSVQAAGK